LNKSLEIVLNGYYKVLETGWIYQLKETKNNRSQLLFQNVTYPNQGVARFSLKLSEKFGIFRYLPGYNSPLWKVLNEAN